MFARGVKAIIIDLWKNMDLADFPDTIMHYIVKAQRNFQI